MLANDWLMVGDTGKGFPYAFAGPPKLIGLFYFKTARFRRSVSTQRPFLLLLTFHLLY